MHVSWIQRQQILSLFFVFVCLFVCLFVVFGFLFVCLFICFALLVFQACRLFLKQFSEVVKRSFSSSKLPFTFLERVVNDG